MTEDKTQKARVVPSRVRLLRALPAVILESCHSKHLEVRPWGSLERGGTCVRGAAGHSRPRMWLCGNWRQAGHCVLTPRAKVGLQTHKGRSLSLHWNVGFCLGRSSLVCVSAGAVRPGGPAGRFRGGRLCLRSPTFRCSTSASSSSSRITGFYFFSCTLRTAKTGWLGDAGSLGRERARSVRRSPGGFFWKNLKVAWTNASGLTSIKGSKNYFLNSLNR